MIRHYTGRRQAGKSSPLASISTGTGILALVLIMAWIPLTRIALLDSWDIPFFLVFLVFAAPFLLSVFGVVCGCAGLIHNPSDGQAFFGLVLNGIVLLVWAVTLGFWAGI